MAGRKRVSQGSPDLSKREPAGGEGHDLWNKQKKNCHRTRRRVSRARAGLRPKAASFTGRQRSKVKKPGSSNDKAKSKDGDGDFADEANREGAKALLAHFAEISAEADTSERQQKGPAGKIGK